MVKRVFRFMLISLYACNPLDVRWELTWKQAWKESRKEIVNHE